MTPKFWKYLITNHNGSAICFVAEEEREWTEKKLEGDPCLSTTPQNHNSNARYSAVLPNEYSSSFGGHADNYKESR
jgi:hypothetical protein